MNFTWGAAKSTKTTDPYRDWFDHVYQPGMSGSYGYEIVLVKLKATGSPSSFENTLIWLAEQADSAVAPSDFLMDNVERKRLAGLIAFPPTDAPDVFLHKKRTAKNFEKTYKSQFDVIPNGAAQPKFSTTAEPMKPVAAPIVAIVDDAIGYLNARFCSDTSGVRKTRLAGIWLQTEDELVENGKKRSMQNGLQIDASAIDALVSKGSRLDEAAEYASINETLFGKRISPIWHGITAGAGSELANTHGTQVSDIAGGADPTDTSDPLSACPMLAVQLPPQAVEDTSGSKLQPYVVRAVRWIIDQADMLMVDGQHRPLVVNLSLGVLAGSKDGTSLIERQLAVEVLRREMRTGMPMRIVFAFGNDNLTRQTGFMELKPSRLKDVTLRVQSEDYTPSFVELRGERPEDLLLQLDCLLSDALALGTIPVGKSVSLATKTGKDVARVYSIAAQPLDGGGETEAYYLLAIAPTASFEGGKPIAPSGAWKITLGSQGSMQDVRIEVQRDDRPLGFQALARQSYLDDHALWDWKEPKKTAYTPPANGPVTSRGTHSAWLSETMPEQMYCVGAALGDTGFAAPYSATGAPYVRKEPSLSAIGDSSWTLRGVMASGTLSGTTTVMSGTSVATPQITRELAILFAGNRDIGPWHQPSKNAKAELDYLINLQWSFEPEYQLDQLGPVNVSREAGVRSRLDQAY
jgi:hypothetical protein